MSERDKCLCKIGHCSRCGTVFSPQPPEEMGPGHCLRCDLEIMYPDGAALRSFQSAGYRWGSRASGQEGITLAARSILWGANGDPIGETLEPVRYKPFSFEDKVKYWEDSK